MIGVTNDRRSKALSTFLEGSGAATDGASLNPKPRVSRSNKGISSFFEACYAWQDTFAFGGAQKTRIIGVVQYRLPSLPATGHFGKACLICIGHGHLRTLYSV